MKHVYLVILLLALLLPAGSAWAQSLPLKKSGAAYGAGYYVSASQYDYSGVAATMVAGAQTKYDKAKRIYEWICEHIAYDTQSDIRTADECWTQRRGVCQGYCELYYRLCRTQGIDVDIVYGDARNERSRTTEMHAWVLVGTERGRILVDPTWGAGSVSRRGFVRNKAPLEWFDVDPSWFVFTHLPKRKSNQRLDHSVSSDEFARLPFAAPRMRVMGWTADALFRHAVLSTLTLPRVEAHTADFVRFSEAPMTSTLVVGETYTFTLRKLLPCTISIYNEQDVTPETSWTPSAESITISYTPKRSGSLRIVVEQRSTFYSLPYTIVTYRVR